MKNISDLFYINNPNFCLRNISEPVMACRAIFNLQDRLGLFNSQNKLDRLNPRRESDILSLLTSSIGIIDQRIENGDSITFVKDKSIVRQTKDSFEYICEFNSNAVEAKHRKYKVL